MYGVNLNNYKSLVACFLEECERQFRFLELEHGFKYFSGLASRQKGREIITPYKNQKIPNPFFLKTRYEQGNITLEITYGDLDFSLSHYLYYERISRLNWYDILAISGQHGAVCQNIQKNLISHQSISQKIEVLAKLVQENIKCLTTPSLKLIQKATNYREKRIEEAVRTHAGSILKQASKMAARAFSKQDYRMVIEILTPHELMLKRSDMNKLKRARKFFMQGY